MPRPPCHTDQDIQRAAATLIEAGVALTQTSLHRALGGRGSPQWIWDRYEDMADKWTDFPPEQSPERQWRVSRTELQQRLKILETRVAQLEAALERGGLGLAA